MARSTTCKVLFKNADLFQNTRFRHNILRIHTQVKKKETISVATSASDFSDNEANRVKQVGVDHLSDIDPALKRIDLSFENAREAYKSKTNGELFRSLCVFNMCSIRYIVQRNEQLLKWSRGLLGKKLFEKMMKATFYGQFVAGEDEERICPTVRRNQHFGIKSILDYSVEKDLSREQAQEKELESCVSEAQPDDLEHSESNVHFRYHREFGDRRELVKSARTYFYEDERACEENLSFFLRGIDAVSGATSGTGFAAIKLTALGRPQLLLQLTEVLVAMRRFYDILASGNWNEGTIRTKDFERHLKSYMLDAEERSRWLTLIDASQDGVIDLLDWHNLLEVNISLAKVLRVPNLQLPKFTKSTHHHQTGSLEPLSTGFTEEEAHHMKMFLKRIDRVAKYSQEKDVRVMIDAEQTYFQPAINRLCMEMMRKYNKEKAYIFNTYQCYLKEAFSTATVDLALSQREDFYFGAKLVRGAYMEQERVRAKKLGYPDPINPTFEATTAQYERVLDEMMRQISLREKGKIAVMVASHNEDTIRHTLQRMKHYDIKSTDRVICFGQLLGMCDQVSFSLGQAGYSVYKYVPYGPVEEVIPYLSRRAQENGSMLSKLSKEKRLLTRELWRRIRSLQWRYDPIKHCPEPVQIMGAPPVSEPLSK